MSDTPDIEISLLMQLREAIGINRREAAELTGIHENTLYGWEVRSKSPTATRLLAYLKAIGLEDSLNAVVEDLQ